MRCSMDKFIDELTMASYESDIDLDRDIPDPNMYPGYDVDVDEDGPFITTADEDSFDEYLNAHPDFNAALNGHPNWI